MTNHGLWQTGFLNHDVGPNFSPIDGYTSITDIRGPTGFAVYSGPFTQQFDIATTRAFHGGYSATAEYGGTLERPFAGTSDAQFLRRISLAHALGSDSQIALILREISGTGGFAAPGNDLAVSFHKRFRNQSQLYLEYGSPAAYGTLQRFVLKYVYHVGAGGAGT